MGGGGGTRRTESPLATLIALGCRKGKKGRQRYKDDVHLELLIAICVFFQLLSII